MVTAWWPANQMQRVQVAVLSQAHPLLPHTCLILVSKKQDGSGHNIKLQSSSFKTAVKCSCCCRKPCQATFSTCSITLKKQHGSLRESWRPNKRIRSVSIKRAAPTVPAPPEGPGPDPDCQVSSWSSGPEIRPSGRRPAPGSDWGPDAECDSSQRGPRPMPQPLTQENTHQLSAYLSDISSFLSRLHLLLG